MTSRYELSRLIKRGAAAEVWEGRLLAPGGVERRVAIKRALLDADPIIAQSFFDEARLASQLHHANIVPVIDTGELEGVPFQVQELVDGLDLDTILRLSPSGCVADELALFIVAAVATALDYAHRAKDARGQPLGIVHRDVTPENIVVSYEGDVKLTDFGNAYALRRLATTAVGVVKGQLAYLSAEQARGELATPRSDVFSLGCVLHAAVAGRSPFEGKTIEVIAAGTSAELDRHLADDVRKIIARACRSSPDERHRTALELGEECEAALARRGGFSVREALRALMSEIRTAITTENVAMDVGGIDPQAPAPRRKTEKLALEEEELEEDTARTWPSAQPVVETAVLPRSRMRAAAREEPTLTVLQRDAPARSSFPWFALTAGAAVFVLAAIAAGVLGGGDARRPAPEPAHEPAREPPQPAAISRDLERDEPGERDEPAELPPEPSRKRSVHRAKIAAAPTAVEERAVPTPERVNAKLKELAALLVAKSERLDRMQVEALEREYFELRASAGPDRSEAECRALLERIAEVEKRTHDAAGW